MADEPKAKHHPYCNYGDISGPVEECAYCKMAFVKYPYKEGDDVLAMTKEHFPGVQVIVIE